MKYIRLAILLPFLLVLAACTDLKEQILDGIVPTEGNVDVQSLLDDAYLSLQNFQTQDNVFAIIQHPSDETLGPTRGTDWDDNGIWRTLHDHTWDAEHNFNRIGWNSMGRGLYLANNILAFSPNAQQEAEARFIRAFYVYTMNDLWGQVPMRTPGEDIAVTDPTVMSAAEATDFVITELEAIAGTLPDNVPAYQASKNAAYAMLAKAYINRGVHNQTDRSNPTFDAADMNKVIENCDKIIMSGAYSVDDDFYDNFRPQNDAVSSELIFTSRNMGGMQAGNVRSRWFQGLHYNQNPSGWNGFTTIADFYDKFTDPNDVRLSADLADQTPRSGLKGGFLIGQQFDENGVALEDRRGNPLAFTKEVVPFETGDNLEVTGIRVMKYVVDFDNGDNVDNDYVFLRYSDILLMKAEAIARGGTATMGHSAASLVNEIRAQRNVPTNSDGSLNAIYDERGFELYLEGWRRNDQIRFGTYLDAWTGKPVSESYRCLFPIPAIELAASPNLQQNPGY